MSLDRTLKSIDSCFSVLNLTLFALFLVSGGCLGLGMCFLLLACLRWTKWRDWEAVWRCAVMWLSRCPCNVATPPSIFIGSGEHTTRGRWGLQNKLNQRDCANMSTMWFLKQHSLKYHHHHHRGGKGLSIAIFRFASYLYEIHVSPIPRHSPRPRFV